MKSKTVILIFTAFALQLIITLNVSAEDVFVVQNFYVDSNAGYADRERNDESWTDIRDGVGEMGATYSIIAGYAISAVNPENWRNLWRASIPVDTSMIPDSAQVVGATFKLSPTAVTDTVPANIVVVSSGVATTSAITAADYYYTNWGTTFYSEPKGTSEFSMNQYNDISLNEAGKSYINKTGFTDFGLRVQRDIEDVEPTGVFALKASGSLFLSLPGTPNLSPYLEVSYVCNENDLPTSNDIISVTPLFPADYNNDGVVNANDITDFISDQAEMLNFWIKNSWQYNATL